MLQKSKKTRRDKKNNKTNAKENRTTLVLTSSTWRIPSLTLEISFVHYQLLSVQP